MCRRFYSSTMIFVLLATVASVRAETSQPAWEPHSPRSEITPKFTNTHPGGSRDEVLSIATDDREGLAGCWYTVRQVEANQYYRFEVYRRTHGIGLVRRAAPVRLLWLDDQGKPVLREDPTMASYRPGERPRAEPEFPADAGIEQGWTKVTGTYKTPPDTTRVKIELHLRWAEPNASVEWTGMRLEPIAEPDPRTVRLATIHYRPQNGKTPLQKCEQFAPLIAQAAAQEADLVVLPETLTYYASGGTYADAAETIPGPCTDYFCGLAKKHQLHLVAGLLERDEHLIYNVSVLIGPDGAIVGKYRKVALPRGEIEGGITPGRDYPVFETSLGKIGMMICYDGFFPEVARELANQGAEIIAWPVWGCNPLLAAARACENHVYVVSSTYTDIDQDWMVSAVFGHDGKVLAQAEQWGSVVVAEVNLDRPLYWHSLGDFRAQIQRHRPPVPSQDE